MAVPVVPVMLMVRLAVLVVPVGLGIFLKLAVRVGRVEQQVPAAVAAVQERIRTVEMVGCQSLVQGRWIAVVREVLVPQRTPLTARLAAIMEVEEVVLPGTAHQVVAALVMSG
jgi:hypothetical protein